MVVVCSDVGVCGGTLVCDSVCWLCMVVSGALLGAWQDWGDKRLLAARDSALAGPDYWRIPRAT